MGPETNEEKEMKKQFGKLSKATQEKIEVEYHQMKPEEFEETMSRAKRHTPNIIRLPPQLVEALKAFGIEEHLIPDPMNVFMRQDLSAEGTFEVLEPVSKAGDAIVFRLLLDCILAISACPQDQNPCNGWAISDLLLVVGSPQ